MKKILFIDMDTALTDFQSGLNRVPERLHSIYAGKLDQIPGIYAKMKPITGAVKAFHDLSENFETHIISSPPWKNPSAWTDKLEWVNIHLGDAAHHRLTFTHHKELLRGDFLIDGINTTELDEFQGTHIEFDAKTSNWADIVLWLKDEA
jgi:5'-nucleotidase